MVGCFIRRAGQLKKTALLRLEVSSVSVFADIASDESRCNQCSDVSSGILLLSWSSGEAMRGGPSDRPLRPHDGAERAPIGRQEE